MTDDKGMTIAQVCEYLQVKPGALAQLRYTGKGPAYTAPTPKMIRYQREDVDAWLEAGRRISTTQLAPRKVAA